jgi:hypothetical protein
MQALHHSVHMDSMFTLLLQLLRHSAALHTTQLLIAAHNWSTRAALGCVPDLPCSGIIPHVP